MQALAATDKPLQLPVNRVTVRSLQMDTFDLVWDLDVFAYLIPCCLQQTRSTRCGAAQGDQQLVVSITLSVSRQGSHSNKRSPDCYFHLTDILPAHWPASIAATCAVRHTHPNKNQAKSQQQRSWRQMEKNKPISSSSDHVVFVSGGVCPSKT